MVVRTDEKGAITLGTFFKRIPGINIHFGVALLGTEGRTS